MTFETEHEHGHGHKTGVAWLDVVVAVSAVFISVVSLIVSISHGRTMERLVDQNEKIVAADTMPYLMFYDSAADPQTYRKRASVELKNGGVGPALVDWLEVRWRGRAYTPEALIRACCAPNTPRGETGIATSNMSGFVLPARETAKLMVDADVKDPAIAEALDRTREELTARACYCSVLNECWITDFKQGRPKPVKDCRAPAGLVRW
jgi:hypothetical protein